DLIQNVVDGEDPDDDPLAEVLAQLEQVVAGSAVADVPEQQGTAPEAESNLSRTNHTAPLQADGSTVNGAAKSSTDAAQEPNRDVGVVNNRHGEESVRVPVGKMDRLMGEVSELLVARMQAEERMRELQLLRGLHGQWRR